MVQNFLVSPFELELGCISIKYVYLIVFTRLQAHDKGSIRATTKEALIYIDIAFKDTVMNWTWLQRRKEIY